MKAAFRVTQQKSRLLCVCVGESNDCNQSDVFRLKLPAAVATVPVTATVVILLVTVLIALPPKHLAPLFAHSLW